VKIFSKVILLHGKVGTELDEKVIYSKLPSAHRPPLIKKMFGWSQKDHVLIG